MRDREFKLDLLDNAIDSLSKAVAEYDLCNIGRNNGYKYAIIFSCHYTELILKYIVSLEHPILIYDNHLKRNSRLNRTIGAEPALNLLGNLGYEITADMRRDIEHMLSLRNQAMHHELAVDKMHARRSIARLIRISKELCDISPDGGTLFSTITKKLDKGTNRTIELLLDEYMSKLHPARFDAMGQKNLISNYECPSCLEWDVTSHDSTNAFCHFCEFTEPMGRCCQCGDLAPSSELSVWNDDHETIDKICRSCEEEIDFRIADD